MRFYNLVPVIHRFPANAAKFIMDVAIKILRHAKFSALGAEMAWYLLIGLGAVVGGLLMIFYSYPPISSQDWASWVQAVGSIAAIFFAWLIGKSQLRIQDRQKAIEKHEETVAQSETCEILAEQAIIVLKNIITKFEGPEGRFELIGVERIKELQHSLRTLSSKNIPPKLFNLLLPIQRELDIHLPRCVSTTMMVTQQVLTE